MEYLTSIFSTRARDKSIHFEFTVEETVPRAMLIGDSHRLLQVCYINTYFFWNTINIILDFDKPGRKRAKVYFARINHCSCASKDRAYRQAQFSGTGPSR